MVCMVFLGWVAGLSAQDLPTCAVLGFDGKAGVTADEASLLSDRFAVELGRLAVYKVINQARIKDILNLQKSSRADYMSTSEGAIEVGQLLGVQFVVHGTAGRVGNLYTLNTYLTSVESGEVVGNATTARAKTKEELLLQSVAQNARELVTSGGDAGEADGRMPAELPVVKTPPPAGIRQAQALYDKGLYEEAAAMAKKAMVEAGASAEAHLLVARCYEKKKGWTQLAAREVERAVELDPANIECKLELARIYDAAGEGEFKSVPVLKAILALEPTHAGAREMLQRLSPADVPVLPAGGTNAPVLKP